MRRKTITEVAECMNVEPDHARAFVKILVQHALVVPAGTRKNERGLLIPIYEFPDGFEDQFADQLKRAALAS